jgi:hypothetical protein
MRDKAQVRNFIMNVAAALEVGFLTWADLPDYLAQKRLQHEPAKAPVAPTRRPFPGPMPS